MQLGNLFFLFLNQKQSWVHVDMRYVRDAWGSGRVLQSWQVFFLVQVDRCQTSNHQTKAVSSQTLPQQRCQFWLTVRDVLLLLSFNLICIFSKCGNYLSECKKRFVYFDSFLEESGVYPVKICVTLALTSRQINQLELWHNVGFSIIDILLVHCEG